MSAAPDDRDRADAHEPSVPDLRRALRAARVEEAERSRAIADLRGVELARLEDLQARLAPVLAQVSPEVDLFDAALMPVPRPRLFIDMIAFVEMGHDRHTYRFVQDRRDGRVVLCESERLDAVAGAVTSYIARRLVEREMVLAGTVGGPASPPPRPEGRPPSRLRRAAGIGLDYLGVVAIVVLLWVLGHAIYDWAWPIIVGRPG